MDKQCIATTAGWMAAAWTKNGLAVLVLPQKERTAALAELDKKISLGNRKVKIEIEQIAKVAPVYPLLLERNLILYFQGLPVNFEPLPIDLSWCTPFQKKILQVIRKIPYGKICSYHQVAEAAGALGAARPVGNVAGANRTPIVIPCHRVIRKDGKQGGFSGGLKMKNYLLKLEAKAIKVII